MNQYWRAWRLGFYLGWADIRDGFVRTLLGPLWLTFGMFMTVLTLGLVFSNIFSVPIEFYLPYVSSGFVSWSLIAGTLAGGSNSFVSAGSLIHQIRLPLETHVCRNTVRSLLTFALVSPVVLGISVFLKGPSWNFLILPVLLLPVILTIHNFTIPIAILTSRLRDVSQLVTTIMNVMAYLTPIFWMPSLLGGTLMNLFLNLNPFFHALQLLRQPLNGELPSMNNLIALLIFFVLGVGVRYLSLRLGGNVVPRWVS